jgi:hypothetical protein
MSMVGAVSVGWDMLCHLYVVGIVVLLLEFLSHCHTADQDALGTRRMFSSSRNFRSAPLSKSLNCSKSNARIKIGS